LWFPGGGAAAGQSRLRLASRTTQKFGRQGEKQKKGNRCPTRERCSTTYGPQLAPEDTVIKEARERRDTSKAAGESFPGALRSYNSGSLAHGTANCPVHQRDKGLDADCGVVLDRRAYPTLGPDGGCPEFRGTSVAAGDHQAAFTVSS
jgi:hypothetical protein